MAKATDKQVNYINSLIESFLRSIAEINIIQEIARDSAAHVATLELTKEQASQVIGIFKTKPAYDDTPYAIRVCETLAELGLVGYKLEKIIARLVEKNVTVSYASLSMFARFTAGSFDGKAW